jgi:tRNA A37 threonylcarbamoyladenosine dehydratase
MARMDAWRARFGGIDRLYGSGTLAVLSRMHVCVVGLGGVGSWAVEALARSGIGKLTLIDADDYCLSNSNRQLGAEAPHYGKAKAEVLAQRAQAINPAIGVEAIARFATSKAIEELLDRGYDYVFDACDAFRVKIDMIAFCRRRKIPILVCGSAGGRVDPTRVQVRDLNKTEHDILLGLIRRKLRAEHGWTANTKRYFGVLAVYSLENVRYPQADGSVSCRRPADTEEAMRLDCAGGLGAAMHVTATFGMVGVAKIIERLLERAAGKRPR